MSLPLSYTVKCYFSSPEATYNGIFHPIRPKKIKFLEVEVKILKEKEVKLEKESAEKIGKSEELKDFIPKTKKEKDENFEIYHEKFSEIKNRYLN